MRNQPEPDFAPPQTELLLTPIEQRSAWSLACILAKMPHAPDHARAVYRIEQELTKQRGKSQADLAEMIQTIKWAIGVMNPPGQQSHQVVGDLDDVELAVEVAEQSGQWSSADLEKVRQVAQKHAD